MNDTDEFQRSDVAQRLDRLEEMVRTVLDLVAKYEPLLAEATRRMEAPLRWRRDRG